MSVFYGIKGLKYIEILKKNLNEAFNQLEGEKKPDLIIFNAGTDPLEDDKWGAMKLSSSHMIERDQIVFQQAKERKIPIVYLISGGYTSKSAKLIGESIENVLKNVIGMEKTKTCKNVPHLFKKQ